MFCSCFFSLVSGFFENLSKDWRLYLRLFYDWQKQGEIAENEMMATEEANTRWALCEEARQKVEAEARKEAEHQAETLMTKAKSKPQQKKRPRPKSNIPLGIMKKIVTRPSLSFYNCLLLVSCFSSKYEPRRRTSVVKSFHRRRIKKMSRRRTL